MLERTKILLLAAVLASAAISFFAGSINPYYYDILITIVYNRDLLRLAPLIIFNLNHHLIGYIGPALVANLAFNYYTFK